MLAEAIHDLGRNGGSTEFFKSLLIVAFIRLHLLNQRLLPLGRNRRAFPHILGGGGEVTAAPRQKNLVLINFPCFWVGNRIEEVFGEIRIAFYGGRIGNQGADQVIVVWRGGIVGDVVSQPFCRPSGIGLDPFAESALDDGGTAVSRREGL